MTCAILHSSAAACHGPGKAGTQRRIGQWHIQQQHTHAVRRHIQVDAVADLHRAAVEAVSPGSRLHQLVKRDPARGTPLVQQDQSGLGDAVALVDAVERRLVSFQPQVEL